MNTSGGRTSVLASALFLSVMSWILISERQLIFQIFQNCKKSFSEFSIFSKLWFVIGFFLISIILGVVLVASLYPPHLLQESDSLVYHIAIPRQHLIMNSFQHLSWSTADLYLLPLDFALAPYWLVTELPNKFPQFLFSLGLIAVSANVLRYFCKGNFLAILMLIFAIWGTHGIAIQMGTAMLDIVMCYLLIAAFDSFISKRFFLSALEGAFFFWSKSFIPPQMILILVFLILVVFILKKLGLQWSLSFPPKGELKRFSISFLMLSLIIAGPFLVKSTYYAGTPLYPFGVDLIHIDNELNRDPIRWKSLNDNVQVALNAKDHYGFGRSPLAFVKFLLFFSVPTGSVNNEFD